MKLGASIMSAFRIGGGKQPENGRVKKMKGVDSEESHKKTLRAFLGVPKKEGSANGCWSACLHLMFEGFSTICHLPYEQHTDLDHLIAVGLRRNDCHSYFWSWLQDVGKERLLAITAHSFADEDDVLDLLDMQLYLLGENLANGNADNLFFTIADSVTSLSATIATPLVRL